eukprot:3654878-Ditylum_brightwellii.AAC.1
MANDLVVPDVFMPIIEKARDVMQELVKEIPQNATVCKILTMFINLIDGTREFVNGKEEQCSVCVGFADSDDSAVAGVVYHPLTYLPTWAAGAKSEAYFDSVLNEAEAEKKKGLLTTNVPVSPFFVALRDELKLDCIPSGGAGNKMLMLLEGRGTAYKQDWAIQVLMWMEQDKLHYGFSLFYKKLF